MEEPKGDKRSKAYREWKAHKAKLQEAIDNKEAFVDKGLGDKIEEITEKTGIKKAVKKIFGDDCGCNERKAKLNKAIRLRFPVVRCFTEQQFNQWNEFAKDHLKSNEWVNITRQQQKDIMIPIYAHIFARQLKVMNCCLSQYLNEINKVYNEYL